MKIEKVLLLLFACLLLVSCKPILKRYESVEIVKVTNTKEVQLSSFVTEVASSAKKTSPIILQLSDKGQAELIRSVAEACKGAEKETNCIYGKLGNKFPKSSRRFDERRNIVKVKIVFSAQKNEIIYNPANRISKLITTVTNPSEGVGFSKWDKFKTEYAEVDLGSISSKNTSSFNASLSPTLSGTVVGAGEVGVSFGNETTEEVALKKRYVSLTGILSPKKITLFQEGVVGIDLEGNYSIDLTVTFDKTEEQQVFRVNQAQTTADKMVLELAKLIIPSSTLINSFKNGLNVEVKGEYVLRSVGKGHKTIIEGDDSVSFKNGLVEPIPNILNLISHHDFMMLRARYYLHLRSFPGKQLSIDMPWQEDFPLDFATYAEAEQFLL